MAGFIAWIQRVLYLSNTCFGLKKLYLQIEWRVIWLKMACIATFLLAESRNIKSWIEQLNSKFPKCSQSTQKCILSLSRTCFVIDILLIHVEFVNSAIRIPLCQDSIVYNIATEQVHWYFRLKHIGRIYVACVIHSYLFLSLHFKIRFLISFLQNVKNEKYCNAD